MRTRNLGITLDQDADFSIVIGIQGDAGPIDITGYSFKGQMRPNTDPATDPVASFSFLILDQYYNKGQVKMTLPLATVNTLIASVANSLQTKRLTTPYMFDVLMKDTVTQVSRIIQGVVNVSPSATEGTP